MISGLNIWQIIFADFPNGQGSGKLLRLLRNLVDKSKSGQFWSETRRKASGQIVSGQ